MQVHPLIACTDFGSPVPMPGAADQIQIFTAVQLLAGHSGPRARSPCNVVAEPPGWSGNCAVVSLEESGMISQRFESLFLHRDQVENATESIC